MSKKKHPPQAMINDLNVVFKNYNWSGEPIGIKAAMASDDEQDDPGPCPDGQTPHDINYQLPDGTVVTKRVCL